jgi:DNA-directed RNA polymerase specialized sigma24 family protein
MMPTGATESNPIQQPTHPGSAGRVDKDALETALSSMARMQEVSKERVRAHLLGGMALREIAARDGVGYETISNAVRRVRVKLQSQATGGEVTAKQWPHAMAIVRARADDLEKVLAQMPRMLEQTKERMRLYFLEGKDATSIAAREGIRIEGVNNAIRHVRAALAEQDIHWRQASFTLTLPITLGKELQVLSDNLPKLRSKADAEALLEPIMRQINKANGSLK